MPRALQILQYAKWPLCLAAANAYVSHFVGGWAAMWGSRQLELPSMAGKVVVVTGGNAGIGLGVVRELALLGATVVLCCRSRQRGEDARASLPASCAGSVRVMDLDLGSLASVRAFAGRFRAEFARLDVLVLNAGRAYSFLGSQAFHRTADGLEEMVGVNFLGHFLLTCLLLPVLRATAGARVIANTSVAAANSYPEGVDARTWTERSPRFRDWMQYGQSKLALLLFMRHLQEREPSLLCLACHPGVVDGTALMHERATLLERLYSAYMFRCLAMRRGDGWHNTVFLAATAEALHPGGFYMPVGRLARWPWRRAAHAFQRVGALQAPARMATEHAGLWEEAEAALRKAGG